MPIFTAGITVAMECGSLQQVQAPDAVVQNRPVRPEQLLNPDDQAIIAPGRFDLLRGELRELYSTHQNSEARVLRVMLCLPLCWPCLGCLFGYRYLTSFWFDDLRNMLTENYSFRTFLNNLASDNHLQILQFNNLQIIIIWLNWILGTSDSIQIQIAEGASSEQTINVIASQNFGNNTLRIDTSAIRDRIVTFHQADTIYLIERFNAMVSIINTNESIPPIVIYQRSPDYIRVLTLYDLRDFSVTGDLQAVINTELERLGHATETNVEISTIQHFLIRDEQSEWVELDSDATD
ncbi:hypothetical protein NX722_10470 [Endozoicomonas gorgoniicola]|uniref:Uncharacterized protein n=1 Tax=Endozoicomonas gorgoniicola TaxID=1234144 RepID=A0ABT3MUJ4_9GAMM|nr:hypothetical protein [Endozoicomonas gorgoniicola]MCW7553053.1 hypothetical protein [Endozoicomonas gorgoniicola]